MSYNVKYRIIKKTQSGVTSKLDLLEDNYAGDIIEYIGTFLNLQYIPSSDDPFEPIYASQLSVGIYISEDVANIPDFTTLNDRKYICKLYADNVLEWIGFALSDNVSVQFTTGFRELSFNCICGLGMLDSITFSDSNASINTRRSLLYIISSCLSKLSFDAAPNIFTSLSIYALSMNDRDDADYYEPLNQCYIQLISCQSNGKYVACLQVLREILTSFGCRIYMAKGVWNICQINQQAIVTPYYTEYDGAGAVVVSSGTFSDKKTIVPFSSYTSNDLLFIGNTQAKILKKGFDNIVSENTIVYPGNYIFNADLKLVTGLEADGWTRTEGGTGTVVLNKSVTGKYNTWIMNHPTTGDFAQVDSNGSLPVVAANDEIKLSMYFFGGIFANVSGNACFLILTINTGSSTYYLDTDGDWQLMAGPVPNYFAIKAADISQNGSSPYNLTVKPAPAGGDVGFGLRLDNDTGTSMTVGNFAMTMNSPFKGVSIISNVSNLSNYTKKIEFPYGLNSNIDGKYSYRGFISDIDGNMLKDWYMMERKTVETFRSLAELMVKNYIIQFRKNIINIDCSLDGIGPATNRSSARMRVMATDSDPAQISVNGKYYIFGNTDMKLQTNDIDVTLLEVTDTDQPDAVITTTYDNSQDDNSTTTARRLGSNAGLTKDIACTYGFGTQMLYFVDNTYPIGAVAYNSNSLNIPFNGASLWWKVEILELASVRAMRISGVGVIMDVQLC